MSQLSEYNVARGIAYITILITVIITGASLFKYGFSTQTALSKPVTHSRTTQEPSHMKNIIAETKHKASHETSEKTAPLQQQEQAEPHRYELIIGQGSWYVQVGAFQKTALAYRLSSNMKVKYKHATVIKKQTSYAVWVGPVVTKEGAKQLQKHIFRHVKINGFVVKRTAEKNAT